MSSTKTAKRLLFEFGTSRDRIPKNVEQLLDRVCEYLNRNSKNVTLNFSGENAELRFTSEFEYQNMLEQVSESDSPVYLLQKTISPPKLKIINHALENSDNFNRSIIIPIDAFDGSALRDMLEAAWMVDGFRPGENLGPA